MRRITRLCRYRDSTLCALFAILATATISGAQARPPRQGEPRVRPEVRIDYLASPDAIQLGAGAVVRVSNYVRLGAIGGAGPHFSDEVERFGWRAELLGRFQVDPFRERRWAPYAAAGVSIRGAGSEVEEYLMLLLGLEGPLARGWSPAIEAGFGGGFRAGLVMRRGGPRSR